jgi:hypothetical protein
MFGEFMKVAVYHNNKDIRIQEMEKPKLKKARFY